MARMMEKLLGHLHHHRNNNNKTTIELVAASDDNGCWSAGGLSPRPFPFITLNHPILRCRDVVEMWLHCYTVQMWLHYCTVERGCTT